jgi:serine/threonine protein phosphatase PrpC
MLAVSRAIGDLFLQPYITAEPDVHTFELKPNLRQVLVMGCDGVWDVLEDEEGIR